MGKRSRQKYAKRSGPAPCAPIAVDPGPALANTPTSGSWALILDLPRRTFTCPHCGERHLCKMEDR